ncbi:hypothetical protein [Nannocystis pusilla]|uniref:hypothetical protein n=1 Tax=Nannocystis pusilla TaxID=889268 RepID=UPI003B7E1EAD
MIEHLGEGGAVREGGRLVTIPAGSRTRTVRLGGRERLVVAVPWGDLATAHASTGIENITTWMSFPKAQVRGMRLLGLLGPLLRRKAVIKALQALVDRRVTGPNEQVRESGSSEIWGRVEAPDGRAVEGRVRARGLQVHGDRVAGDRPPHARGAACGRLPDAGDGVRR